MDIAITKMSSKGQVVIPKEMRGELTEGEKILVIKNKDQLILKKATGYDKQMAEDLEFAKRTEEAWRSYDRGEFESMPVEDFLKELEEC